MPGTQELTDRMRDRLLERFALTEAGDPYEPLVRTSDGSEVGSVRVWTGEHVACVVDTRLVVPDLGIDSTMLHAFTRPGATSPHLVSDLAGLPHGVNFHVDLVPRVDLASQPDHLDSVYPPLTEPRARAYGIDGATPVAVPPRLMAFSSPWLVGVTVTPAQLDDVEEVYVAYLDRFEQLLADPPVGADGTDLARRDEVSRRAQFDAASDPVWDFLARLVGQRSVDRVLALLHTSSP